MRSIIFLLSWLLIGVSCKPDKHAFVIEGEVEGIGTSTIYLIHPEEMNGKVDSIQVKNNKFRIKGIVEHPNVYRLAFGERHMPLSLILEPGIFRVEGDLKDFNTLRVEGGPLQNAYNDFYELMTPISESFVAANKKLSQAKSEQDEERIQQITEDIDVIKSEYFDAAYLFVENRPADILSAMLISDILFGKPDVSKLQPIVDQFDEYVQKTSYGQKISTTLSVVAKTAVGLEAPLFTMNDDKGEPFELESLRGKYVLIDFWASWCQPCRVENPRIVKTYQEFGGPKFTILGVSIDDNQKSWKKAIEADGLIWKQVIDEGNVSNEQYGVIAIPTNILIDPDGIIIGRNLFGKELNDRLEELLK